MVACIKCGAVLAKTEELGRVCYPCQSKLSATEREQLMGVKASHAELLQEKARSDEALAAKRKEEMFLATEMCPMGLEIKDRLGIITAECVFGMNVFRDFFAGIRDMVGGRSSATQKVFRDARKIVLNELRDEAFSAGGNAVIAVAIQYSQLPAKGDNMLMVAATGTVVVVAKM